MKNIRLIPLLIMIILAFQACKNGEEENAEADLIGVWEIDNLDFEALINEQDLADF